MGRHVVWGLTETDEGWSHGQKPTPSINWYGEYETHEDAEVVRNYIGRTEEELVWIVSEYDGEKTNYLKMAENGKYLWRVDEIIVERMTFGFARMYPLIERNLESPKIYLDGVGSRRFSAEVIAEHRQEAMAKFQKLYSTEVMKGK